MVPSSVLYCYREWGVDEALVTDEGVVPSQPKSALTQTSGVLDRTSGGIDGVSSLKDLRSFFENFEGCALKRTAQSTVFSDGCEHSSVMLVGEAPGAEEDRQGKPFVGRSGKLLDAMLAAIGLDRRSVYIANIVPWRPPGNRVPTPEEVAVCLPLIEKHIALINPNALLLLGNTAAKALLRTKEGITRLRGRVHDYKNPYLTEPIHTVPTFHPAYLLRSPLQKREAWHDLLTLKNTGSLNVRYKESKTAHCED